MGLPVSSSSRHASPPPLFLLLVAVVLPLARRVDGVLVNNSVPMLDVNGAIVDCADASIQLINGRWWQHCVSYGLCQAPLPLGCPGANATGSCGFQFNHNISIWTSPDLSTGSWTFEGLALPYTSRPQGILYRPDVVFNAATKRWVLWANIVDRPVFHGYFAATSISPAGPFEVVSSAVNLTRADGGGDFHLFVDDDGVGYVIYTTDHYMGVEQLTADFTASTGKASAIFPTYFVEAPSLMKRNGIYYALFGSCCCFCYQGSGVKVHTAPHPLGPWTLVNSTTNPMGDVACVPPPQQEPLAAGSVDVGGPTSISPEPTPDEGCLYANGTAPTGDVSVTRSQQNYLIRISGGRVIWTGNRWGQSPDGIKGHEPLAWLPLNFLDDNVTIAEMQWVDAFEFTP